MEVVICDDDREVGHVAAAQIAHVVEDRGPSVVLGVATGSSPMSTYAALAELVDAGRLDLSHAQAFALDEYVGLPKGHPQSYHSFIQRHVVGPLHLNPHRVHVPDGTASDLEQACIDYELAMAAAGGVDVQILGVGSNGHIGFNEPSSSLSSRTRLKTLTRRTREDNQRFFPTLDAVPTHCLTQGLGTILDARSVVLVASGEHKADAVAAIVEGPVTARRPGSVLQFHRFATIVVDEAAASKLELADYYRQVSEAKPLVPTSTS